MHVIVHPVIKRSLWSLNTPNDSIPVESLLAMTTQREEDLMELCVLKILYCRLSSADICFCKPLSICSFIMYVYEVVLLLTQFKENPSLRWILWGFRSWIFQVPSHAQIESDIVPTFELLRFKNALSVLEHTEIVGVYDPIVLMHQKVTLGWNAAFFFVVVAIFQIQRIMPCFVFF